MSRLNRNFCVIFRFIEQPKTPGITSKNMAFSEGKHLFAGDFHAVHEEINFDILQFTKK